MLIRYDYENAVDSLEAIKIIKKSKVRNVHSRLF